MRTKKCGDLKRGACLTLQVMSDAGGLIHQSAVSRLASFQLQARRSNSTLLRIVRERPTFVVLYIGALVVGWFSIVNIGSQTWMWITYVVVACVMAFLLYTWPDVNMRTIGAA